MKYFMETELRDKTTDLISIRIVAEDERELYLQSVEFDSLNQLAYCGRDWRVVGDGDRAYHEKLGGRCQDSECPWRSRKQMQEEILSFLFNGSN